MKKKTIIVLSFLSLIALQPSLMLAVETPKETVLSVGDLSLFEKGRELPLQSIETIIAPEAKGWTGVMTTGPDFSFFASGPPLSLTELTKNSVTVIENDEAALNVMKTFAELHREDWNVRGAEFIPLNARRLGNTWHVSLQQAHNGNPVFGSRLEAKVTPNGRLIALSARLFPIEQPGGISNSYSLPVNTALRQLTTESSSVIEFSRRMYYPVQTDNQIELKPAWQVIARTDRADLRPAGIIDARTGEVLLRYNDVAFDQVSGNVTGLVLPMYWDDIPQEWVQRHQRVEVTGYGAVYTDTAGNYTMTLPSGQYSIYGQLKGRYVDVNYEDGPDASYNGTAWTMQPHSWLWNYNLARQDEANMYYHVTAVHDFFKVLDPTFTALDYPLPATVAYGTNYENAFWNGSGIYFGEGAGTFRNFALFCDVIYHEYTHGVTDMIYPYGLLPYTGQPGAMNEAWSDYFACTITNESQMGEGGLYTNGQVMRDLNNTLVYPINWAGEVHADGRIIGGAFWDLREAVGAAVADSVLHFAKYALSEMWEDYFVDVLVVDDNDGNLANGGPHHPEIYEAFGIHGIGPGAEPELVIGSYDIVEDGTGGSVGNGDGFYDPGEILSMDFTLADLRYLYPPPAENVTVSISSDDPDLSFEPDQYQFGDIPAGASIPAPDNLLITISTQAELSFSQIYFAISANGGAYQVTDSVEIVVGHPLTLLVDDDAGANFQQYFDEALRNGDQFFSTYDVYNQGAVPLEKLNEYESVIWLTGNASTNTLTLQDRNNLASFLNAGGNLLVTGQDLAEDIGTTTFFSNYLKASVLTGSVGMYYTLDGVDGDPISENQWLVIIGAGAGNNQTSPAAISALSGAEEIYHYAVDPQYRPAGVRYDSGVFKTVTLGFGAEAVSGLAESTPLEEVLSSVLEWFGTAAPPVPEFVVDLTYISGSPVPSAGGNLYYGIYVLNDSGEPQNFDAWIDIVYEGGSPTTALQRSFTNFQPGWTINRPNVFFPVPGSWAGGNYEMIARVGVYPNTIWQEDSFPWVKEGSVNLSFDPGTAMPIAGYPNPFDEITQQTEAITPAEFGVTGIYPNPFNPTTALSYTLQTSSFVSLTVYDIAGREVAELVNGWKDAGVHEVTFDGSGLPSGIYFLRLEAGEYTGTQKMVLLK